MQRALGDLTYGRYGLNVTVVGWYHDTSLGEISDTTMIQNSDRYFTLPQSAGDLDLSEFDLLMLYGLADSGSSEAAQGQSQLVRDLACEAACEERGEDSCLTTCQIGGRSDFGTIFAINTVSHTSSWREGNAAATSLLVPSTSLMRALLRSLGVREDAGGLYCGTVDPRAHDTATTLADPKAVPFRRNASGCYSLTAANPFSVLGSPTWATHAGCQALHALGVLDEAQVQTVQLGGTPDTPGTYRLSPLSREEAGYGVKCLRIELPEPLNLGAAGIAEPVSVVWLSHRQAEAIDAALGILDRSTPSPNSEINETVPSGGVGYLGVQLELATSDAFGGSWLLDTHAGSAAPYLNGGVEAGVWMDATLLHGETLSCAALGLHLGVSALGDSGVELKVSRLQNGETCAAGVEIIITVYTDPFPSEISWRLVDASGAIVASMALGDYTLQQHTYTHRVIVGEGNHTFVIEDSESDGLCCTWGMGTYSVRRGGTLYASGSEYGASESTSFFVAAELPPSALAPAPPPPLPPSTPIDVSIQVTTDDWPIETGWLLFKSSGEIVESLPAGTYTERANTYTHELQLQSGTYALVMLDTYRDGLCCSFGNGAYTVTVNDEIVASGSEFGAAEARVFQACPACAPPSRSLLFASVAEDERGSKPPRPDTNTTIDLSSILDQATGGGGSGGGGYGGFPNVPCEC